MRVAIQYYTSALPQGAGGSHRVYHSRAPVQSIHARISSKPTSSDSKHNIYIHEIYASTLQYSSLAIILHLTGGF